MITRGAELLERKTRGAFFTPPAIAQFLAEWAVQGDPRASVLDPSCGEAVFLLAAARHLRSLGATRADLESQVHGVDIHQQSLETSAALLKSEGLAGELLRSDFFDVATPGNRDAPLPFVDAIIGNPPFVRFQEHAGENRRKSSSASLAQGVRLSGLASSWAALLVHSCAFLKPGGRLAMVLPAELLTVHYAEPIRRWLRRRFATVHLVMFDRLQFDEVLEKVVLVVASGEGGCNAFALHYLNDADDLFNLDSFDNVSVTPSDEGKWTDLLMFPRDRQLFKRVADAHFTALGEYGAPELGTVTGANDFFMLSEETRQKFGLTEAQVIRACPPGTRHLKGTAFTKSDWTRLHQANEAVWMLYPDPTDTSPELRRYIRSGVRLGVEQAYKCQVRSPWWRPPRASTPDLFFTYMSHRYPRLIANNAGVTFVNSMHGIRLRPNSPTQAKSALPLLMFNAVTMVGAEVFGRSYGGGVLKMEPREAASLPVPTTEHLKKAWLTLRSERASLDRQLRRGVWVEVAKRIDQVLLNDVMGIPIDDVIRLHDAARLLRERRIGSPTPHELQ